MATQQKSRREPWEGVEEPYEFAYTVRGVTEYFFSRSDLSSWDNDKVPGDVRTKGNFDPEDLVWRDGDGFLACPREQVMNALVAAGRYMRDPMATGRRSGMEFIKESIIVLSPLAVFDVKEWDAIDVRIATYANGRKGPRRRPILHIGWKCSFRVGVNTPQVFRPSDLSMLVTRAGQVRGLGDNHKYGYGRYTVEQADGPHDIAW